MSKSVDIFFPFYIGDYLKKTQMLSCEEHGAYMLLTFSLYQNDGYLALNEKRLARVCKLSESEFTEIWEELSSYFIIEGGFISNKRVLEEIEKAQNRKKKASENGKKGGRPKKADHNLEETQDKPTGLTTGKAKTNLEESSSPSPSPSHSSSPTNSPSNKEEREKDFATLIRGLGFDLPLMEIDKFIDYWTESSPKGKKMLFEMKKTFDPSRRLANWKKQSQSFKTGNNNGFNKDDYSFLDKK